MPPESGDSDPSARSPAGVSVRATRRCDRPRCRADPSRREPADPCRQRCAAAARQRRAPDVRRGPPHPGGGDVHGQGRHRRPPRPLADGGRPPGARPRPDRVRSRRSRRQRRLRPGRIRAGPLERRPTADDRPHRHAAGRGRRGLPARGRADRRHQRQPRSACASSSARATPRAPERLVHDDLRQELLRELDGCRDDTGWPIKPQKAIVDLRRALAPDDIVVSDVGAHKVWVARLYQAYEPNTVIISNGFAAMGIGVPGAIAAKLVHPDRKVVAVVGDGAFLMNSQELETARRIGTNIVVMVWRDDGYGLIDWKQRNEFGHVVRRRVREPGSRRLRRELRDRRVPAGRCGRPLPDPDPRPRRGRPRRHRRAHRLPREPAADRAPRGTCLAGLTGGRPAWTSAPTTLTRTLRPSQWSASGQ